MNWQNIFNCFVQTKVKTNFTNAENKNESNTGSVIICLTKSGWSFSDDCCFTHNRMWSPKVCSSNISFAKCKCHKFSQYAKKSLPFLMLTTMIWVSMRVLSVALIRRIISHDFIAGAGRVYRTWNRLDALLSLNTSIFLFISAKKWGEKEINQLLQVRRFPLWSYTQKSFFNCCNHLSTYDSEPSLFVFFKNCANAIW